MSLDDLNFVFFFTSELEQKNVPPKVWFFSDQIAMKDSSFMMECIAYGR